MRNYLQFLLMAILLWHGTSSNSLATEDRGVKVNIDPNGEFLVRANIEFPPEQSLKDIFSNGIWNKSIIVDMDDNVLGMKFSKSIQNRFDGKQFDFIVEGKKIIKAELKSRCNLTIKTDQIIQNCTLQINSFISSFLFYYGKTSVDCKGKPDEEKICAMTTSGRVKDVNILTYRHKAAHMAATAAFKYAYNAFLLEHILQEKIKGNLNTGTTDFEATSAYIDELCDLRKVLFGEDGKKAENMKEPLLFEQSF